jgi:hypothetical protein
MELPLVLILTITGKVFPMIYEPLAGERDRSEAAKACAGNIMAQIKLNNP